MVLIQPRSDEGQRRDEQEVKQVDIQGVGSCVLQCFPQGTLLAEPFLIMAEEHHHNKQQGVHSHGTGQVGPRKLQSVKSEDVCAAHHSQGSYQRKEPHAVKEPLYLLPIPVYDITQQKELHKAYGLYKAGICKERCLMVFETLRKVEVFVGYDA